MPELRHIESKAAPRVATFPDHQIITPPNRLRHAISSSLNENDGDAAVARAEKALASLSEKFPIWMQAEWARLAFAHAEIAADGLTEDATRRLLQIAHDICGNAPLYGYATAAEIAGSLCRLIEESAARHNVPRALIARHVDAVGAIARGGNDAADAANLRAAVTQYLLRASSVAIAAPMLVPE